MLIVSLRRTRSRLLVAFELVLELFEHAGWHNLCLTSASMPLVVYVFQAGLGVKAVVMSSECDDCEMRTNTLVYV